MIWSHLRGEADRLPEGKTEGQHPKPNVEELKILGSPKMIDELLKYVQENKRVCPNPDRWNDLWGMLPARRRIGGGWDPPAPLILAAWWDTPATLKIIRLQEHIRYADKHGVLDAVDKYLRGLEEKDWAHIGDF